MRRLASKAKPARRPQGSAVPGARGCRTATHLRGRRCQRFVAVSRRVWHGDVRMDRKRKRERGGKAGRNELPETRGDPQLCLKLVQSLEFSRSHFSSRCYSCFGRDVVRSGAAACPAPLLIYSLRVAPAASGPGSRLALRLSPVEEQFIHRSKWVDEVASPRSGRRRMLSASTHGPVGRRCGAAGGPIYHCGPCDFASGIPRSSRNSWSSCICVSTLLQSRSPRTR
jgi:hypothetical protein